MKKNPSHSDNGKGSLGTADATLYRVDRSDRKAGGSGLGLSIVKHITELMGKALGWEYSGSGSNFI